MEEENNIPTPYTKQAILTASQYFALNNEISLAKGYELGDSTARYASLNPELCKINIQVVDEVETFDLACTMKITVAVQELMPDLELVDNFVSAGLNLKDIKIEGATIELTDWMLNHYEMVGDKSIDKIESDAARSIESSGAVNILVEEEITIITVDDGKEK